MAVVSPVVGNAVYHGPNSDNGTTVAGLRNKVANPLGASAVTGIPVLTGVGAVPATALPTEVFTGANSNNGTTVAGKPAAGSLNVNSTVVGQAVYTGGVYS